MKPVHMPRKSVQQRIQEYEDNIILPPPGFKDDYRPAPAPRTNRLQKEKPVPIPRTRLTQTNQALKGYTVSYEIDIKDSKDPLQSNQVKRTLQDCINKLII